MFFNTSEYYITTDVHEMIYTETTIERHNYVLEMDKKRGGIRTDMTSFDAYLFRAVREF